MKKKTREALDESILHWEDNLRRAKAGTLTKTDILGMNCSLCQRFAQGGYRCERRGEPCPVFAATDVKDCQGSPWVRVRGVLPSADNTRIIQTVEMELIFLKHLREEKPE